MDITPESIARHLGAARRSGSNWSCRCPAHEDRKASLSVGIGSDGKILVYCHAGCPHDEVISHLKHMGQWPNAGRLDTPKSLPPPVKIDLKPKVEKSSERSRIVATYDYTDEHGELLFQAVRFEPKDFRQRTPNPDGSWRWSISGVRRVLYRLPEVLEAVKAGKTIYVTEGEKDVEAARSLGLVATCNPMGADNGGGNKWLSEFASSLQGADVVIVPDQDEPGIRHAERVISTLRGVARSVRVSCPTTGKDLADWVEAGASVQDIEAAAVDAFEEEVVDADAAPVERVGFQFLDVADLITDIKPIEWLVRDYFERDSIALIYGQPGGGKSFFAIDIAACIATGNEWFGKAVHSGPVFYIAGEGHNGLARRFKAWEVARGVAIPRGRLFKSAGALAILDEEAVLEMVAVIDAQIQSTGEVPSTIFIDTLARNFGSGDENSTEDMSRFIANIDKHIRHRWQCCVVIVHHSGHNMERARGSSALKAAVDAEYEVSKDDSGTVTIRTTKMKDAELPPEMMLQLKGVELPGVVDEDGKTVTSAILVPAGNLISSVVAKRDDGSVITAKDVLVVLDRGWLSIRALGEALECSKRQAEKCIAALKGYKFIDDKSVTADGKAALSRTGHELKQPERPFYKRGGDE